jgi:hypothetical protein
MIDPSSSTIPLIIAAVGSGIAAILSSVAVIIGALNKTTIESVKKTGEVTNKISDATHTLTNSAMGAQLLSAIEDKQALSVVLHSNAKKSGVLTDLEAAQAMDVRVEAAKKLYQEHVRNQAVVDAKLGNNNH